MEQKGRLPERTIIINGVPLSSLVFSGNFSSVAPDRLPNEYKRVSKNTDTPIQGSSLSSHSVTASTRIASLGSSSPIESAESSRGRIKNQGSSSLQGNDDNERRRPIRPDKLKREYDSQGRLLLTGEDLCDCLSQACEGCFAYPCPRCGSHKCGFPCRSRRKYLITSAKTESLEGMDADFIRYQPFSRVDGNTKYGRGEARAYFTDLAYKEYMEQKYDKKDRRTQQINPDSSSRETVIQEGTNNSEGGRRSDNSAQNPNNTITEEIDLT